MKCEDALMLISGHIDGENTPEEDWLMQAHLENCGQCRQILQAYLEQDDGIAALTAEPPADLCGKVMEAIAGEKTPKKKQKFWPVLAAAAAVALVIGLGTGYLPAVESQPEAAPIAARNAVVEFAEPADFFPEINGQILSDVRRAYVVETDRLLPEMESWDFEVLEDGSLLYLLPSAETALELSEKYDLKVFWHQQAEEAYALLLNKGE